MPDPTLPPGGTVIRRSLLVWGLGHLALGDRRGWLWLALEVACLALLVLGGAALVEGSFAIVVFGGIVLFLALWGAQAVAAYRVAVRMGARPGGQIQVLALAPLAIVLLTGFWLEAGSAASPAATLERYVSAWRERRPDLAQGLFREPQPPADLLARWDRDAGVLAAEVARVAAERPGVADLDPEQPFESIQFVPTASTESERASYVLTVVHPEQREASFFGLFPAARQELVADAEVGTVELRLVPGAEDGLAMLDRVWRIESVRVAPAG